MQIQQLEKVHLYISCFDFVDETIARICRPVLNERVIFSHHKRAHGAKSQCLVLPRLCTMLHDLKARFEI